MNLHKVFFKLLFLTIFILTFFLPSRVFAESGYVLPYPAVMPGNKLHRVQEMKNMALKYWYFGSIGQFEYNRKMADTYLVEAKTLFEYKQYLLGFRALQKSNNYFEKAPFYLERAEKEGKDISEKKEVLKKASEKHKEVLSNMQQYTPKEFFWQPEKVKPTMLKIHEEIEKAIEIRNKLR